MRYPWICLPSRRTDGEKDTEVSNLDSQISPCASHPGPLGPSRDRPGCPGCSPGHSLFIQDWPGLKFQPSCFAVNETHRDLHSSPLLSLQYPRPARPLLCSHLAFWPERVLPGRWSSTISLSTVHLPTRGSSPRHSAVLLIFAMFRCPSRSNRNSFMTLDLI